jgi:uncharacterized phage-associated protein
MPSVLDVAAYILERLGESSSMKLQKLVYYAQAWSLVWDEEPLFSESLEAWANGPVCRALYEQHKGKFKLEAGMINGNPDALDADQRASVDAVINFYGQHNAQWLIDLTHQEEPWLKARDGVPINEKCENVIELAWMAEYYSGLNAQNTSS